MKRFVLILSFALIGAGVFSQGIADNRYINGSHVVRSSAELAFNSDIATGHFRIVSRDSLYELVLGMFMTNKKGFTIRQDSPLALHLSDGSIIKLKCDNIYVACKGCAKVYDHYKSKLGVSSVYPLTKDQLLKLQSTSLIKLDLTTDRSEWSESIPAENQNCIIGIAKLFPWTVKP
jgi:hypothetical protein